MDQRSGRVRCGVHYRLRRNNTVIPTAALVAPNLHTRRAHRTHTYTRSTHRHTIQIIAHLIILILIQKIIIRTQSIYRMHIIQVIQITHTHIINYIRIHRIIHIRIHTIRMHFFNLYTHTILIGIHILILRVLVHFGTA